MSATATKNGSMPRRAIPFLDALEAAAKPYRELWRGDGKLSLAGLKRHYANQGHPVSDASLSRIFNGKQAPGEEIIEATHMAFGVPKGILRGEPVSAEMEKTLTDYKLSTLLLAQKLESLPKDDYHLIFQAVERALENQLKLKKALESSPNVTPIDRRKR